MGKGMKELLYSTVIIAREDFPLSVNMFKGYVTVQYEVRRLRFEEVIDVVMFIGSAALSALPRKSPRLDIPTR